uniref:Uncharacterized protein n=1 Tax=Rhizophora mucronata TaxID=61149 RepID=A0A2P2PST8_RHIMU
MRIRLHTLDTSPDPKMWETYAPVITFKDLNYSMKRRV